MPRPRKCRRVCHFPGTLDFGPLGAPAEGPPVTLTVEEYEALRLIDREGLSQEQCGASMGVARTTVQQLYASAREKVAAFLVEGRALRIEGGDYRLCRGGPLRRLLQAGLLPALREDERRTHYENRSYL